jgi:hypothetical protein
MNIMMDYYYHSKLTLLDYLLISCAGAGIRVCVLEGEKTELDLEATRPSAADAPNPRSSYTHLRCLRAIHQDA